jgi:hypothetical protein
MSLMTYSELREIEARVTDGTFTAADAARLIVEVDALIYRVTCAKLILDDRANTPGEAHDKSCPYRPMVDRAQAAAEQVTR